MTKADIGCLVSRQGNQVKHSSYTSKEYIKEVNYFKLLKIIAIDCT